MRKVVLAVLTLLLLFPLTINGSGAYFFDTKSLPVNIVADPDSPFFLLLISSEGVGFLGTGDHASITSTGCNDNFNSSIMIDKAKAKNKTDLRFDLGTITNKSDFVMNVLVEYSGTWPSQGGSGKLPNPVSYTLSPGQDLKFQVYFNMKVNNGTPTGVYKGSIKFTLTINGLPGPIIELIECVTTEVFVP